MPMPPKSRASHIGLHMAPKQTMKTPIHGLLHLLFPRLGFLFYLTSVRPQQKCHPFREAFPGNFHPPLGPPQTSCFGLPL